LSETEILTQFVHAGLVAIETEGWKITLPLRLCVGPANCVLKADVAKPSQR
jgi:hypothetical protein